MKFTATLTRTIQAQCVFESTDMQTGTKLPEYSVPMTLSHGPRRFRTASRAKAWVELMNKEYGPGTAIYNGSL